MRYIIAVVAVLSAFTSMAVASDDENDPSAITTALASRYLDAYSTYDMSKIEPFLAEDAVFFDPTSSTQNADGGPFMFDGKDAILNGLGDYAAQYKSFTLDYDIERQYESQGHVVFVATLIWTVVDREDQIFSGAAPIVTVISIQDSKVVRHTDYYDYKDNAQGKISG